MQEYNVDNICMYMGRRIEDLSREELIAAVKALGRGIERHAENIRAMLKLNEIMRQR